MAFCPKCGTQVPDDSQFCPACGAQVGAAEQAPQPVKEAEALPVFEEEELTSGQPWSILAYLALAVLFAQGVGSKQVWRHVFDVPFWNDAIAPLRTPEGELPGEIDVFRHVKNTVEESFELASYLLLFASAALPPALASRLAGPRDRQTV